MKRIGLRHDPASGYFLITEDGVGLARTKSGTAARRIRDALTRLGDHGLLIGQRVQRSSGIGVVVAVNVGLNETGQDKSVMLMRLEDHTLETWPISHCTILDNLTVDVPTETDDGLRILHVNEIRQILAWDDNDQQALRGRLQQLVDSYDASKELLP